MPNLVKIKGLLLKRETVYGTDSIPTALLNGVQVEDNLWSSIDIDFLERNTRDNVAGRGFGSGNAARPSGWHAKFTIQVALKGTAVAAEIPEMDVPLAICGFKRTDDLTVGSEKRTWSPVGVADTPDSATAYIYAGGMLYKIAGVRGRLTGVPFLSGKHVVMTIECMGLVVTAPVSAVVPAITYAQRAVVPPVVAGVPLLFDTYGPRYHSATFDMGTELVAVPRANAPDAHAGYELVDYQPTLKAQIDAPHPNAWDARALERTQAVIAWSIDMTAPSRLNRIRVEGTGQISKLPHSDRDKMAMMDVQLRVCSPDATPDLPPFKFIQS